MGAENVSRAEYAAACVAAVAATMPKAATRAMTKSRGKPAKATTTRRRGPPPPVDEVVAAALRASNVAATNVEGGFNPLDRRFRWHAIGASRANITPTSRTPPVGVYRRLLGDGAILREALMAVQTHVASAIGPAARGAATVVVGGSTGMRLEQAGKMATTDAFDAVSDVDVDVYVAHDHSASLQGVVAAVDRACMHVMRDAAFAAACEARMPPTLTSQKGRRFPARVYAANDAGVVIAVDVPTLAQGSPRVHAGPVFATRNDTLDGTVLHRIRIALARAGGDGDVGDVSGDGGDVDKPPASLPIVDIKTRVGEAPPTIARRVAGLQVRVPTAKHAIAELERLLRREYDNVDASKDSVRHKQLACLRAATTRGSRSE